MTKRENSFHQQIKLFAIKWLLQWIQELACYNAIFLLHPNKLSQFLVGKATLDNITMMICLGKNN